MGYYDPPEPSWVGEMEVECNAEVERRIVTPGMEKAIAVLRDGPDDPWAETRPFVGKIDSANRALLGAVSALLREYRAAEPMTFTCQFDGPTEVALMQGRALWTCPMCGEPHDDDAEPYEEDPDPDRLHDERRERLI